MAEAQQQDPTALTTERINREVEQAVALLRAELRGEIGRIEARLDASDQALSLVQEFPTDVQREIKHIKELFHVEIETINRLLEERYKLRKQWEESTSKSVDTAFAAAKELVAEQRYAAEKAIDKSERTTAAELAAHHAVMADLKERLVAQELQLSNRIGAIENTAKGANALWVTIASLIAMAGIIVATVATVS